MSDMICWMLSTGMRCMAAAGPMNAPFTDYYINPRPGIAAEAPRALMTMQEYNRIYQDMGMRTNYEYFCKSGKIHPADVDMCARGPHR